MGFSVVHIDEIEGTGPGGAVKFVRCRTWKGSSTTKAHPGRKGVDVIARETGVYRIDGEKVPFSASSIFRFDPETTRQVVGGPEGCTMIAVGARRGSYEPRGNF